MTTSKTEAREIVARAITTVIDGAEKKKARGETVGPATLAHIEDAYATAQRVVDALYAGYDLNSQRERIVEILEKHDLGWNFDAVDEIIAAITPAPTGAVEQRKLLRWTLRLAPVRGDQ